MTRQHPPSGPFLLTKEERELFSAFKRWLRTNLPDKKERALWVAPEWETRWHAWRRWQKKMCEAGWMGISWPKEYGGREATHIADFLIGEELAAQGAPHSGNWISLAAIAQAILAFGSDKQKREYLPGIARGEDNWCLAVTEPEAGSNVMATATKAVLEKDHFVVNGRKIWSTHSPYASRCLLLARTDDAARPEWGMSMLIVDLKGPGVTVSPLRQLQGETNYGEILFRDVRVPKENLVGTLHGGWIVQVSTWLAESLPPWDIPHRIGIRPLLQLAKRKVKPGSAEARRLGELILDAEMVRLTAVKSLRDGKAFHYLRGTAPLTKIAFTETSQKITEAGLDWCDDEERALWDPTPEKWLYRHVSARSNTLARAPSEVHRNFLAHSVLGLPR